MKTRSWISSVCFSRCTVCIVYVVSDVIQFDMNWLAHISWENTTQCAVLIWRWFLIFTKVLYLYFELLSALCFRVEGHVCKRIIFALFLQCCWRVCGGGRSCDVMRVFQLQCEALRETRRWWKICSAYRSCSIYFCFHSGSHVPASHEESVKHWVWYWYECVSYCEVWVARWVWLKRQTGEQSLHPVQRFP